MAVQSREDPLHVLYTYYLNLLRSKARRTSRNFRLAATVALLFSIVTGTYGGFQWWVARSKEKAQGRQLLRKNSGLRGKDGSRIIYVPYRNSTAKVTIHPTKPTTFDAHRRLFLNPPRAARLNDGTFTPSLPPPQTKPGLNLAFLHQFLSLLSIMIPRWNSKETGLLLSHGLFLVLRTYLSLVVARLDGAIVRDLVAGNGRSFTYGILRWLSVGTLASYTNSMIKFLQSKISIAFRTRLTRYIHDLYLNSNLNYYKLSNLDGGVGQGADQFITQDLTLFCSAAAALYSSLGKPLVDIFVFNYQLYRSLGPLALTGLLANYFATATLLRRLSPPFGKLKAVEGRKEGDFRSLHARLIANAEEVAFYGGAEIEKVYLNRSFKELQSWMEGIYGLKVRYNMLEDFVLKYSWSAFGYIITSLPVFLPAWGGLGGTLELTMPASSPSPNDNKERGRMKEFITNKRLMLSLADAGGRMMYSIKDLSELAGYTSRVYTLISTLHRVHANAYFHQRRSSTNVEAYSLADVQGTIQKGFDGVRLEDVPVVAPSLWPYGGDELIESLSFVVHSGEHLLISGSNGVGKSAIARIVGGLWPVYRGLVSRPRSAGMDGIMFLPQRPYLSIGTLRDQVIYPHTEVDMREAGRRDHELQHVLDEARLGYLPEREGGWDTRKEWKDVLSGGEKQRMAIARLLYHEPRYAFIDEGTSAVSSDVEGILYETAKEKGITLITISTRASLKKYHTFNLTLGLGDEGDAWDLKKIGTEEEKMDVENELAELRRRLEQVENWRKRREQIDEELRKVMVEGGGEMAPPPYLEGDGEESAGRKERPGETLDVADAKHGAKLLNGIVRFRTSRVDIELTPSTSVAIRYGDHKIPYVNRVEAANMVYDWADHRDVCYQMYITERKSLEEIMAHMKEACSFTPSKRAYQTQFKRWGFPSKQNPAHRNVDLVTRVKELWEKNTSQRDMLKTLTEEGFNIKERELMRVRAKNRWLLRVPNGMKSHGVTEAVLPTLADQATAAADSALEAAGDSNDDQDLQTPQQRTASPSLSPEVIKKRKERYQKLQAESDERWAAKKRRRRTRGWAGLPADPPGPPRFPSETTIDESKTYLGLDSNGYRQLRDDFQKVCEEAGVIKKTLAGPEKWQAVKDRLIRESRHLQQVFWTDTTNLETKNLALDVICTDVTKRMRTMERRMTIAEAKNILGVNPEESRRIRNAFYGTLKADHFTSKLEAGDEHWKELKEHWIKGSPLLQSILAAGESDPEYANKVKAMEVLCRDVMKRLRDDQTKRDPVKKDNETHHSTGSPHRGDGGTAYGRPAVVSRDHNAAPASTMTVISNGISSLASKALARTPMIGDDISDLQIDPSLLEAANHPSFSGGAGAAASFLLDMPVVPVPVYIRPHPKSQMHKGTKMWLGSLHSRTVFELRQLLQAKWPDAAIVRIDGVDKDQNGPDISYLIEEDEELDAYLTHVQDRKATIVVMLNRP